MLKEQHQKIHQQLHNNLMRVVELARDNKATLTSIFSLMLWCGENCVSITTPDEMHDLDMLVADWIFHEDALPSKTPLEVLIQWSEEQTRDPS